MTGGKAIGSLTPFGVATLGPRFQKIDRLIPIVVETKRNFDGPNFPSKSRAEKLTAHGSEFDRQKKEFALEIQQVTITKKMIEWE